jgi:ABC-type lipoprotein release transport system permease subunit
MFNRENRYLFRFVNKSIRRNAGRSFFIGLSVSLAVVVAVWVLAFFDGVNRQIERSVVQTNLGYFQLQEHAYSRTTDPSHPLPFTPELRKKLDASGFTYSPELLLDGNISAPEGAAALLAVGIVPELHESFLPIKENVIAGEFLTDKDSDQVVIGQELAKVFKLKPGEQIVYNYQDVKGELRSEILTIKGIYHFSSNSFEKRFIYVNDSTWQKLYLNRPSENILFNRICLMTPDLKSRPDVEKIVQGTDLVLRSWKDLNPEMSVVMEFNDGMIRMFFVIIAITVLMTILTPVQMLWQERFKELKMMNILGVSNKKFWKLGIFEVIHMVIYAGSASSVILLIILSIQSKTGVMFRFSREGVNIERAGIKLTGIVYPVLSASQIAITFVFIILVLASSYVWAIHRTLKKLEAER